MSSLVIVPVPEFSKHRTVFEAENTPTVPKLKPQHPPLPPSFTTQLLLQQKIDLLFFVFTHTSSHFFLNSIFGPLPQLYIFSFAEKKNRSVWISKGFILLILQLWYLPPPLSLFAVSSIYFACWVSRETEICVFFAVQIMCVKGIINSFL